MSCYGLPHNVQKQASSDGGQKFDNVCLQTVLAFDINTSISSASRHARNRRESKPRKAAVGGSEGSWQPNRRQYKRLPKLLLLHPNTTLSPNLFFNPSSHNMPINHPCQRLLGQVKDALRTLKNSGPEAAEEAKEFTEQLQNLLNHEASDNEYRFFKYLAADKITIKDLIDFFGTEHVKDTYRSGRSYHSQRCAANSRSARLSLVKGIRVSRLSITAI